MDRDRLPQLIMKYQLCRKEAKTSRLLMGLENVTSPASYMVMMMMVSPFKDGQASTEIDIRNRCQHHPLSTQPLL